MTPTASLRAKRSNLVLSGFGSLAQHDIEDCGPPVIDGAPCAADRLRQLGGLFDLLAVEAERLAEFGVVGTVDRHTVPNVGLLRDSVGIMVQMAGLHRAVLAVVANDDQDRQAARL